MERGTKLRKSKTESEEPIKVKSQKQAEAPARSDGAKLKAADKAKARAAENADASLNRETKRMMKKRENAADRLKRPAPNANRKRTKPSVFIKEVRGELGRVAWPTRPEVITYSTVVLVTVIFFMVLIAGIDFVALKGVLYLIGLGDR